MEKRLPKYLPVGAVSCLLACTLHHSEHGVQQPRARDRVVVPYAAFGPQAMAFELIGNSWNQWKNEGHQDHDDVVVQVVVYSGVGLEQIKKAYPVVRGQSDYRYVEHGHALRYLESHLRELAEVAREEPERETMWVQLSARLARTHREIVETLGER